MPVASIDAALLKTIDLEPLALAAYEASLSVLPGMAGASGHVPPSRLDDGGLLQLLDALSDGVILLDGSGSPVLTNARARALLAVRDGLRVDADGLAGTSPDATRLLRQVLATVGVGPASAGRFPTRSEDHGHLALPRRQSRLPLLLRVLRLSSNAPSAGDRSRPRAVLFLRDPEKSAVLHGKVLSDLFGLTRREAELALASIDGERLECCASRLGMGLGTARQHLKHVYEKTGVHNRAGLCCLIRSCASM